MTIPTFPDFKPIELDDKPEVDAYLRQYPPLASEYTFSNLFAWQQAYHYRLARYGEGLLILKETAHGMAFMQPLVPGDAREAVRVCLDYLREKTPQPLLERVGEDFITHLPADCPEMTVQEDRDNFDYLYSTAELIALAGEKYHDKKNLLNQFVKKYHYQYVPLTEAMAREALQFQHDWCVERRCEVIEGLNHENCAAQLMLNYYCRLGLMGGALTIDGHLAAYTLAEPLNPTTLVIHVEKGQTGLTGVYQAINWEFLRHAAEGYTCVNREQDLGIDGLRKTKLSYNPAGLVKKYRITPRNYPS